LSEQSKEPKPCTCEYPELPTNLPLPPDKYQGRGTCGRCKGFLVFPIKRADAYEGNDPVLKYVDQLHDRPMGFEKASLNLLLSINANLERLVDLMTDAMATEEDDRLAEQDTYRKKKSKGKK